MTWLDDIIEKKRVQDLAKLEAADDLLVARVVRLPNCDFGDGEQARYDFKTKGGAWAYGCQTHYEKYRFYPKLGTGKGQRLVLIDEKN